MRTALRTKISPPEINIPCYMCGIISPHPTRFIWRWGNKVKIKLGVISAIILSAAIGQATAGGSSFEKAVPMVYLSIPLGGSSSGLQQSSFGVGVERADYERNSGFNFMSNEKPRVVDLSFQGNKPHALRFNGINTLQQKLIQNAAATTTSTASLRKSARAASGAPASTTLGTDSAASKATDIERQDHVTNKQTTVSVDKEDRWVLNLVSLSSKAGADHIAEKALSKDIKTEQQQVTVKGEHYWRVQITGFSTAAEAAAYADNAKEKLGLKGVWITKR